MGRQACSYLALLASACLLIGLCIGYAWVCTWDESVYQNYVLGSCASYDVWAI